MSNIQWVPILLIGGILTLELVFNNLIKKNEKYRRTKNIVFLVIAGLVLLLSLLGGDKTQIQNALMFVVLMLALTFYKRKAS